MCVSRFIGKLDFATQIRYHLRIKSYSNYYFSIQVCVYGFMATEIVCVCVVRTEKTLKIRRRAPNHQSNNSHTTR